jgi:serine/threonine kinase 32
MITRFTAYDFKKMQRRSYYPTNQQLISTATATSSGLASSRPGTPANELRVENDGFRVEGSDMMLDPSMMFKASAEIELRPSADGVTTAKEQDSTRVDHHPIEKSYS